MKSILFTSNTKMLSSESELQSMVIDWLRFPLAIAVVFIHSFGSREIELNELHAHPFTLESVYDFIRIAGSNVITHFAVPAFFMFSGYLFFCKADVWNMSVYGQKLKKRFKTLFIPYLLWIVIFVLHNEMLKLGGVLVHGKPWAGMYQYLIDNGGVNMLWDSKIIGGGQITLIGLAI